VFPEGVREVAIVCVAAVAILATPLFRWLFYRRRYCGHREPTRERERRQQPHIRWAVRLKYSQSGSTASSSRASRFALRAPRGRRPLLAQPAPSGKVRFLAHSCPCSDPTAMPATGRFDPFAKLCANGPFGGIVVVRRVVFARKRPPEFAKQARG